VHAARDQSYRLEEIPWRRPDPGCLHAPESMTHLAFTPAYAVLSPEERLTYNQAHARGVCEQFIFLEEGLFVPALQNLLRSGGGRLPALLRQASESFIEEERKHSAMFWRLLREVRPEFYESGQLDVYRLGPMERRFLDWTTARPGLFLWWIWVATLFEEKTLDFHRKHQAERDRLDELFVAVHRFHALDELRHLQTDQHFIELLWEPAPRWKRAANAAVFRRIMWSFVHPHRTIEVSVAELVRRHPRLTPYRERLLGEARGVADDAAWHEATYSRRTLPRTFALFDRTPEMASMSALFPCYRPLPPDP
jgi:hypothetical protein